MKFIKTLVLLSTLSFMGSANAMLVTMGEAIDATFTGASSALGANETLTLATKGVSAVNVVGAHAYDFAEIFEVTVASDLNSVSLGESAGSNSILTDAVIAILDSNFLVKAFETVDLSANAGDTTLAYLLEAANSPYYVAFIGTLDRSNFGTVGGTANYILEISAVPVPAAVWLFGTAIIGLLGFRKKASMAATAA